MGSYDELPELAKRHQIERVIVAIPSLDPSEYERILQMCNKLGVKCYKMPKVETVVQGLHQAGTGFQKLILRTFWDVRKFVLMNRVWAQN